MAKKGLSKLVFAKYKADGNNVTYSDPVISEKLAEYSTEIEAGDSNDLYLDDDIAESDSAAFSSGTFNVTTGDLSNDTSKLILNVKEKKIELPSGKSVTELTYDSDMQSAELGVGVIEMHQVDGKTFYRAVFLARVLFNIPSNAATTKGETVEWQTQELSGKILRSAQISEDNVNPWQFTADLETKANALEYLMFKGGKATSDLAGDH